MTRTVCGLGFAVVLLVAGGCCPAADASAGTTPVAVSNAGGGATNQGGAMPPPPIVTAAPSAGFDREHPVMRCGPVESYVYVASEFRCADGTNPLGGDPRAGAAARVGNVGPNSTGHIIDLYRVPCSEGPRDVYVDMYGCPAGRSPF